MSFSVLKVMLALGFVITSGNLQDGLGINSMFREQPVVQLSEHRVESSGEINLIAHRGLAVSAPENTQPAIQLAGERGYFGCEFDVYPTSDGVWVLSHDRDVSTMTNATGNIMDYTYDELMKFTVDAGVNIDRYPNLKLCTLEEALDTCIAYGMHPVIELKGGGAEDIGALVQMLKEKNLDGQCYITSFDLSKLQTVRTDTSKTMVFYLTGELNQESIDAAASLGNSGLDFYYHGGDNEAAEIAAAREANLTLFAWGVRSTEDVEWLYMNGVFGMTADGIVP